MQKFVFGNKLTALQAANDAWANPLLPWQQKAGNDAPWNLPWDKPWQTTDDDGDDDSSPDDPAERA